MRWTVLEAGDETRAMYDGSRARSAREFLDATARGYFAPAQNMIAADRQGEIAIRSTGHFPLRPDHADGLGIFDGSSAASEWTGFWPVEKYPQSFDPSQGFLASANQQPIDPREAYGYLADDASFDPWRALHINRLLRDNAKMTSSRMREFQTDPGSERADVFLPYFLNGAKAAQHASSPSLDSAVAILVSWDRRYTLDNTAAVLFEAAMTQLSRATWDELTGVDGTRVATPASSQLLNLLQDPDNAWWDRRSTKDRVERRDEVLAATLAAAYDSVTARFGPRASGQWAWQQRGAARINHLLRLPGFSEMSVPIQGGPGTLNPSGPRGFGSSWRMVVELGPTVTAFGTYPGGQSGNPASSRYVDRMPYWSAGRLDTLYKPASASALPPGASRAALMLTPRRP
jgi:penicillin amidase